MINLIHHDAPDPFKTTGIVLIRMLKSSNKDHLSIYSKSSSIHFSKPIIGIFVFLSPASLEFSESAEIYILDRINPSTIFRTYGADKIDWMFVLLHQIPEESDEKQFAFGEKKAANVLTAKNVELYIMEIHQLKRYLPVRPGTGLKLRVSFLFFLNRKSTKGKK